MRCIEALSKELNVELATRSVKKLIIGFLLDLNDSTFIYEPEHLHVSWIIAAEYELM